MTNLILSTTVEEDDNLLITDYKVDVAFKLADGTVTTLTEITVVVEHDEDDGEVLATSISARHTNFDEHVALNLYYNNAKEFEALVSFILGKDVCFTESGMQEDTIASLELS